MGTQKREVTSPVQRFWREIAIVLAVKVVLLTCLYVMFFGPSHRPAADSAAVAARVLGSR